MTKKAILIYSGGMDSTTLLYHLIDKGYDVHALSFYYGQRHKKELSCARDICNLLQIDHDVINISDIGKYLKGSSLTDNIPTPHGHYASENMKVTVVPNRNAIMISIAYGIAYSEKACLVATAVHAGDHFIYHDCRSDFIKSIEKSLQLATDSKISIYAPFLNLSKNEIVKEGKKLHVPYEKTWTCYEGGDIHCGKCGACVERIEALENVQNI